MALLARLAASGLRSAISTPSIASVGSLLARSSNAAAMQHFSGWASAAAGSTLSQQSSSTPGSLLQRQQPHQQHPQQLALHPSSSSGGLWRGISSSAAQSSQCDCPTLGGPTPDIVNVEYDEEEVDRFIALADAIEAAFPNVVVEGNPSGPGRPGAFEVTLPDGAVLFSKLSSGGWPEAGSVVDAIGGSAACGLPQQ